MREEAHVPGDVLIDTALPDGIVHHYMNLGVVDAAGALALAPDVDCKRFRFPRLTDLRAEDVCFDALSCEMPGVANVQQAIDRLCQERDLRWHNRHLHGWGIVCGLIVECGPDTAPTDASLEPQRRRVIVTPGYALASDGSDIVLDSTLEQDMLDLIATHDATASTPIMVNGAGSACLILDRDASGAPTLRVERHVPSASPFADALRGTLLHDFYKDCIEHLIEALRDDLSFLDPSEIGSGEQATDISSNRRKLLAVANLVVQLVDSTNGSFVFLSRNEHATLAELYLTLRNLLQSRTFCGMFEGEEFPTYPFPDTGMDTIVGKGTHIRSVLHPNGEVLYTFGGPGRAIHAYQVRDRKLIAVIDAPAAQGAEVTALAFTRDGRTMYIAAQIRGKDSLYGRCRVAADSASHAFEHMTVLCDVLVTELAVDPRDDDQVFAIGQGRGLFRLLASVLEDSETESTVDPLHAFLASGGARFDFEARRAYATVRGSASSAIDSYSRFAVLDLRASGSNLPPSRLFDLGQAAPVAGIDDFDVRPAQDNAPPRLYIVAGGTSKSLRTYDIEETQLRPVATTAIPSTQIRVRWHPRRNAVLLAIEDEHRLAMLDADGARFVAARIPVQVFPQAITIDNDGDVQVLNLIFGLANTISIIPNAELATTPQFLDALAAYRTAMLTAFYRMFGHVLQYLKDCFCHHLLVKCPQPGANDTIYLACVDVRESQVFNVCNFSRRKYVKSFPTVDYWMSLVPVLPLLREAVGQFCCAVLPSIFARFQPAIVKTPPSAAAVAPITNASGNTGVARFFKGAQVRTATQTFQRTDVKATMRKESKGLALLGMLAGDGLLARTASEARGSGVSKQALIGTDVEAASAQMQTAGVEVTEVRRYAAEDAGKYLQDYTSTPARVPQGSKVTLYERDGKVAFYAIEPSTEFRLDAGIGAELTRLEARKSELGNLAATAQNLEALRLQKDAAQAEVQALQRQVESLRELRTAEEARFSALGAQRETLANGMSQLGDSLRLLSEQHQQLRVNLARDRSVIDVPGVSTAVDAALREAGIRTVGELADADPARLRAIERLQPGLSRTIIDAARGRITR